MPDAIMYQHRQVAVIPGDRAGEYAMRVLLPFAADRLITASDIPAARHAVLREAATMYRAEYAATGMIGNMDSTPGRPHGTGVARFEMLGDEEMTAWRAHNRARAKIPPRCRYEVDAAVLHETETGINVSLLIAGLCALAVHYGLTRGKKSEISLPSR